MRRKGRGATIGVVLVLVASAMGFHLVSAQDASGDLDIDVNAKGEFVTIENTGGEPYDLSGLTLSFDDGQTEFTFGDGVTLGAGESITVGTGDQTGIDADYDAGYEGHLLNNDTPDTVELLDGDTVVASSADENTDDSDEEDSNSDDSDSGDSNESNNEDAADDSESDDDSNSDTNDDSEDKSSDEDTTDDSDENESNSDSDDC